VLAQRPALESAESGGSAIERQERTDVMVLRCLGFPITNSTAYELYFEPICTIEKRSAMLQVFLFVADNDFMRVSRSRRSNSSQSRSTHIRNEIRNGMICLIFRFFDAFRKPLDISTQEMIAKKLERVRFRKTVSKHETPFQMHPRDSRRCTED
jgi:hypothetical protein